MEKQEVVVNMAKVEEENEEEKERLLMGEGVEVLDFDMLCATVALQTEKQNHQWSWTQKQEFEDEDGGGGEGGGGVFRMWEGEVLDCFDDQTIALQSLCCPCYRFGKNMRRAGLASCFLQAFVHYVLALAALLSLVAFFVSRRHYFLYAAIAFCVSIGMYLGFFRAKMRKKFNIRGSDSSVDDCIYHLFCPCCTLSQESRTLEMNNVQDGTWHGRGDTICVGSYSEGTKVFHELYPPPPIVLAKSPNAIDLQKSTDAACLA